MWVGFVPCQKRTNNDFHIFVLFFYNSSQVNYAIWNNLWVIMPKVVCTTYYCSEGGKNMLFMRHSTFWILSPPMPKLSGWDFENFLSNMGLNFLKFAIIESPINKTLHFCELIARYAWFLKVSYHPAFPLRGTGVIRECI